MTKNFDYILNVFQEKLMIQRKGLLPDDAEMFPDVPEQALKDGIYLIEWDLKDISQFKKLLKIADRKNLYIFGQAYPYNSVENAKNAGASPKQAKKKFEKDTARLISMYSKFGFVHTINGYIYRPPQNHITEKAFHASPHNISDKFDLKFVGKGEGNSTFGWGLYFSENPKVSKFYKNKFYDDGHKTVNIYNVDIDASQNELLDLDASLDEQSEYIKEKIKYAVEYMRKYSWKNFSDYGRVIDPNGNVTRDITAFNEEQLRQIQYGNGKDFYEFLENYSGSQKDASLALLKQGIKGMMYFDQFSREDKKGTRNFVIFDDNLIKINGKSVHQLKEMTDAGVYGADGPYPTNDVRTPFVMGTYSRKGKIKKRTRRKKRKK